MLLNLFSGGGHHQHHQQASNGNLDGHAEQQSRELQVHLRGCLGGRGGEGGSAQNQTPDAVQKTSAHNVAGAAGALKPGGGRMHVWDFTSCAFENDSNRKVLIDMFSPGVDC